MKPKHLRAHLLTLAAAMAAAAPSLAQTATWVAPVSGNWVEGARWSTAPVYPNSATVDAVINATGSPYTVTVDPSGFMGTVQAKSVTLNSVDATLDIYDILQTTLLDMQAGTVHHFGGITNARIQGSGTLLTYNRSTLTNVTLATSLTANNALYLNGSFTMDGGTLSTTGYVSSDFDHSQVIDGTGTIVFDGAGGGYVAFKGLTIGAGITIKTGLGNGYVAATSGGTVTNYGTLQVTPGRYFSVNERPIINQGTIRIDGGTFALNSEQTYAALGNVIRTGGTFQISAIFDALAMPMDLDTHFGGSLTLDDGILKVNSIGSSQGSTLFVKSMGGTLGGVGPTTLSVNVVAQVAGNRALGFSSGVVLNNKDVVMATDSYIRLMAGDIQGNGSIIFKGADTWGAGIQGNLPWVIGSGVTIRTDEAFPRSAMQLWGPWTNQGVIASQSAQGVVSLYGTNWKNQGTLSLSAGTLNLAGSFKSADLGSLVRAGGGTAGQLHIGGNMDNTGTNFVLDAARGHWLFRSGSITGGTITSLGAGGGSIAVGAGAFQLCTFDGLTLAGDFLAPSNVGNGVKVVNGLTLDQALINAGQEFAGSQVLGGTGTITLNGAYLRPTSGTLTIGPQITTLLGGASGTIGEAGGATRVLQQGSVAVTGGSLTLLAVEQQGVLTAQANALVNASVMANTGVVSIANSRAVFGGNTVNTGTVTASQSALTLAGDWTGTGVTQITGGTVVLGATAVMIDAPLTLGGTLALTRPTGAVTDVVRGALSGDGTVTISMPAGAVLTFSGDSGQFANFSGKLALGTSPGSIRLAGRNPQNTPHNHDLGNTAIDLGNSSMSLGDGGTHTLGSLAGGPVSVLSGTVLTGSPAPDAAFIVGTLNQSSTFSGSLRNGMAGTLSSLTSLIKLGTGTLTLGTGSTYTGPVHIHAGTLAVPLPANAGVTIANATSSGTTTLRVSSTNGLAVGMTVVGNAVPPGTRIIAMLGTTLTLSAATLSPGTLNLVALSPNALGGSTGDAGNLLINGGVLQMTGAGATNRLFTVGPNGAAVESTAAGVVNFFNTQALGLGAPDTPRTLTLGGSGAAQNVFVPRITDNGTGATSLVKAGSGTWVLGSTANTYTGGTYLRGGRLQIAVNEALPGGLYFEGGVLQYSSLDATDYSGRFSQAPGQQYAVDTNSRSVTFGSALSSADGTFTKQGAGTLTFGAPNTYGGLTTVQGGTLRYGIDDAIGSGPVTVNGAILDLNGHTDTVGVVTLEGAVGGGTITNGTLTTTGSFQLLAGTASAVLAGSGDAVKSGTGKVVLAAANTYSGVTFLNGGTLQLANPMALPAASALFFGGGTLEYAAPDTTDYSARFSTAPGQHFLVSTSGQAVTFATPLMSAGGSLTKSGAGTLVLGAANLFDGPTSVNSGILKYGGDDALGSGPLTVNGAILDLNGHTDTVGVVTLEAGGSIINGTLGSTGSFQLKNGVASATLVGAGGGGGGVALVKSTAGTVTLSGANTFGDVAIDGGVLALESAGALGGTGAISLGGGILRFSAANTVDYSGRMSAAPGQAFHFDTNGQAVTFGSGLASAGGTFTKAGAGTLTLAGQSTFDGLMTVLAGTLRHGADDALGSGGIAVTGAVLDLDGHSDVVGSLTVSGGGSVIGGTLTSTGAMNLHHGVISASLGGGGPLQKMTAGTVTLSGNNSYTGGTFVQAGVLVLASVEALGTWGPIAMTGGTLRFTAANTTDYSARFSALGHQAFHLDTNGQAVTFAAGFASTGNSSLSLSGLGTLTLLGDNTWNTTTLSGATLIVGNGGPGGRMGGGEIANHGSLVINTTMPQLLGANMFGTGSLTLVAGTTTLGGTNSYGATRIAAGELRIGTGGMSGTPGSGPIVNDGRLVFDRAGTLLAGMAISGTGSVHQVGPGTVALSGANSYSGGTFIETGTLQVAGNSIGTGPVVNEAHLVLNHTGTLTLPMAVTGGGTLTQVGGVAHLGGANDFAEVRLQGGTTGLASAGALGETGPIFLTGGVLRFSSENSRDYSARFTNNPGQAFQFDTHGQSVVMSTPLSGVNASLGKSGAGTLTLNATSSYSGATTVLAGTLRIGVNDALAGGPVTLMGTTAVLDLDGHTDTVGAVTVKGGATLRGGTLTSLGTFALESGTLSAGIATAAAIAVQKTTTGTVVLAGNNTYSGETKLFGGVLQVAGPSALPAGTVLDFFGGTLQYSATNAIDYSPRFSQSGLVTQSYSIDTNGQAVSFGTSLVSVSGNFTKLGAGTVTFNAMNTYTGPTFVNGGVLRLGVDHAIASGLLVVGGPTAALDLNGHLESVGTLSLTAGTVRGGTLTANHFQLASGTVDALLSGGALIKSSAGTVSLSRGGTLGAMNLTAGRLELAGAGGEATRVPSLTIATAGPAYAATLDITDERLIVQAISGADKAAKAGQLLAALRAGFSTGDWTGTGITSSAAAADPAHLAVALYDNADLGRTSFGGLPVDANSLLLGLGVPGDANLDNVVDAFDLNILAAHWQVASGATASWGDFSRDGKVDAFDLNLLAANWQTSLPRVAWQAGAAGGMLEGPGASAVPEPGTLLLVGVPALLMARRRRRMRV